MNLALLLLALQSTASDSAAALDRQCFALMAWLAEDEDPRISGVGQVAAQYFLGRLDAAGEVDVDAIAASAPEGAARETLLRRCSEAMPARDFATLDALREALRRRPTEPRR